MKPKEITKYDLQWGDIVLLYSWEEMENMFDHEYEYSITKENILNGNLVADNGYRIFKEEKDLYGKYYMVTKVNKSLFLGETINCIGKRDLSSYEIKKVSKVGDKNYRKWKELID